MIAPPAGVKIWLRRHRYAARLRWARRRGRAATEAGPVQRRGIHLPRPTRPSGEGAVLRRTRPGAVRQAPGTRPIRVADEYGRRGVADAGAVVDADGRDRLAHAAAHLAAGTRRLTRAHRR